MRTLNTGSGQTRDDVGPCLDLGDHSSCVRDPPANVLCFVSPECRRCISGRTTNVRNLRSLVDRPDAYAM